MGAGLACGPLLLKEQQLQLQQQQQLQAALCSLPAWTQLRQRYRSFRESRSPSPMFRQRLRPRNEATSSQRPASCHDVVQLRQPKRRQDSLRCEYSNSTSDIGIGHRRDSNNCTGKFATVAARLSHNFDPETLPQLVTQIPADAAIPLERPIPTPPPTPPVQAATASASVTSIVHFLKRTASTESQFKVTLRKSRSKSRRSQRLPLRMRLLRALPAAEEQNNDCDRPVLYRPRYLAQRRSLVEGLERLHVFGHDEPDDWPEEPCDRRQRRDSCPGAISTRLGRTASYHGRRCRTMSCRQQPDCPPPRSPLPAAQQLQRNSKKHAFYFFHIHSSGLSKAEAFLFDDVVQSLARRYACSLRLLPPDEAPDLTDDLRRVEVAGPNLRDIKKFLYMLTTSEQTFTLQRQIQEQRQLSCEINNSDSQSPTSQRRRQESSSSAGSKQQQQQAAAADDEAEYCELPNGYV